MVTQYKCPSCGADMSYDATTGMLLCSGCGRTEEINQQEKDPEPDIEFGQHRDSSSYSKYGDDTVQYQCKNCGAVLATEKNTSATVCSFCGAPMVLSDRLSGALAPTRVIPFKITKQQAQEAFRRWCKNGRFSPKEFKPADRIKDISGVYIPYWLFDLKAEASTDAACTKVRHYTSGDYNITETRHYNAFRSADIDYMRVPADASKKMDDSMMDKLEPYDYSSLNDFSSQYLAGYMAEIYDYNDDQLMPRIKERVSRYTESELRSSIIGYSSVSLRNTHMRLTELSKPDYTLMPVWVVAYDFKDKEHVFLMNGQTGKIIGKPPLSAGKIALWILCIWAGLFGVMELILLLIGG